MEKEDGPQMEKAQPAEKSEKPDKKLNRTKSTVFNENVKVKTIPSFTLDQLVDLALCAPEIGAVNFNILRMLLRELVEKAGATGERASLTELEAHQTDNFRKYLEGMSVASPMPGVLRIGQQAPPPPKAPGGSNLKSPGPTTPRTGRPGEVIATRKSFAAVSPIGVTGAQTEEEDDLLNKVGRLERQLDVLNDLPSNRDLITEARTGGGRSMSVSEMWQIIQLNNRIAAAEAAIQKMATLIEDLAKNVGKMKGDAKTLAVDTRELATASSDLQMQGQGLLEKYGQFDDVLMAMQKEMQEIKMGWKQDRDNLEKVLGVDLGKIPTFMKERGPLLRKGPQPHPPRALSPAGADADQLERSTQTFAKGQPKLKTKDQYVEPEDITKLTAEEISENITPEELTRMTPAVYKQLSPEQKKALGSIRKSIKLPEPPKRPLGVDKMTDAELFELSPEDILNKMPFEEAMGLSQEILAKMTDEQKEMVRKVIERGPGKKITSRRDLKGKKKDDSKSILKTKPGKQPKLGVVSMTQDQLKELKSADIAQKMSYDEAKNIPQAVLDKMRQSQQDAIKRILDEGPPLGYKEKSVKSALGLASMSKAELAQLTNDNIEGMPYSEAKNLPPEVLEQLTPEQQAALQKVLDAGPPKRESVDDEYDDEFDDEVQTKRPSEKRKTKLSKEEIEMVADLPPYEIAETLTPEQAASIPEEEMAKRFTLEQIEEIEKLKSKRMSEGEAAKLASEMAELLGSLQEEVHGEEEEEEEEHHDLSHGHEEETEMSDYKRRSSAEGEEHEHEMEDTEGEDGYKRKRSQRGPKHRGPKEKKHKRRKTHKRDKSATDIQPQAEVAEAAPPMTLEEYLNSLSPEEAANLAADAVQKEMEKQYKQLQGMQRQLAADIQEKMEFIYQKLLKEIASQQLSSSPFTVGGPDDCMGPGICQGQHMPAGMTVCQVDADKERKKSLQKGQGPEVAMPETVCPGPGPCPGRDICPFCQADASAKDALKTLEGSDKKSAAEAGVDSKGKPTTSASQRKGSDLDDTLLQEMKSLMLLDLEKIRQEMKTQKFGAYDEQDILERLGAVWEALKILKNNEEALALKLARQDVVIKKIPPKTIDKLHKIPDENLEALITGDFARIGMDFTPDGRRGTIGKGHDHHNLRGTIAVGGGRHSVTPADNVHSEDIQTLFDNLANVIAECAEQKERIDQIADTSRILESAMVTKQMLYDAMSDKADRGLINTKVSYDEFGSTIDEVNNQLNNLMVESYQRNENWKKVTSDMAAELSEKLDRVELAPLRAFFKSHLKELEAEVKDIVRIVKEPDPAGTRKKFLRDYNCLSCDRLVNISGFTNGPRLPTIGPIAAAHPTASKRALDVHRIRMEKQCELGRSNCKDKRGCKTDRPRKIDLIPSSNTMAKDMDVMQVVNRYTGGNNGNDNQSMMTAPDLSGVIRRQSKATDPVLLASTANGSNSRNHHQSGIRPVTDGVRNPTTPVD